MNCEICGTPVRNWKTYERISTPPDPCWCDIVNEITDLKKQVKELKKRLNIYE